MPSVILLELNPAFLFAFHPPVNMVIVCLSARGVDEQMNEVVVVRLKKCHIPSSFHQLLLRNKVTLREILNFM